MDLRYFWLIYISEISILLFLAIRSWQVTYISEKIKRNFMGILGSLILWCFGVFMMSVSDTVKTIWFWHEFKFIGIIMLSNFMLFFTLNYTKRENWISIRLKSVLFLIASILLLVIASNGQTHWFRRGYQVVRTADNISVFTQNGPAFWLFTSYSYFLLMIAGYFLLKRYRELPKTYKTQPLAMLFSLIFLGLINLSFVLGILESAHDPSAFVFGITAVIFYWGLVHSIVPNILPIAREVVFDNMDSMLFVKDINGNLVDYNYSAKELIEDNDIDVTDLNFDEIAKQLLSKKNAKKKLVGKKEIYYLNDQKGERYYTIKETPIFHKKEITGYIISVESVTSEMQYISRLELAAMTDALTGLYNRTYYEKSISTWPIEEYKNISIFYGGLNSFKLLNESFSPVIGDKILIKVANKIKELAPEDSLVARTSGDEFSIVVGGMSETEANVFREKIEYSINHLKEENTRISITISYDTYDGSQDSLSAVAVNALNKMHRKKLNDSQSAKSAVISSLKVALEQNNYETKAHADRTEELALAIGRRIGLSDSGLSDLSMLSSLHDLGKIAIPDSIINKPGKLTKEEFEVIKTHPQKGYYMAIASPELVHIAEGILHHHERWDGKGYPDGLKGEETSIEARIICIVDAYDVMTNVRPYKTAMTTEEAVAELKRCRGSQFDPNLVDILVDIVLNEND